MADAGLGQPVLRDDAARQAQRKIVRITARSWGLSEALRQPCQTPSICVVIADDRHLAIISIPQKGRFPAPVKSALYLPPSGASGRARTAPGNLGRTRYGGLRGFAKFAEIR